MKFAFQNFRSDTHMLYKQCVILYTIPWLSTQNLTAVLSPPPIALAYPTFHEVRKLPTYGHKDR